MMKLIGARWLAAIASLSLVIGSAEAIAQSNPYGWAAPSTLGGTEAVPCFQGGAITACTTSNILAPSSTPTVKGLTVTGANSGASIGTNGIGLSMAGANYTDSAASGSVSGVEAIYAFGSSALLTTNTATYANGALVYIGALTAGSGTTLTANYSLYVNGPTRSIGLLSGTTGLTITGGAVNLDASSNFAVNLNTGTSTGTTTIGNSASLFTISASRSQFSGGPAIMPVYTVSTLPSTSATGTVQGAKAIVSDATSCSLNGSLTGSSTVVCPVYYNGTAWVGD